MNIILSNSVNEPIYQQIVSQVKSQILSGELVAGDALPSMRNLAMQLKISVITTKRAYEELERDGFIENFTGRGCFVKAQNTDFLREQGLRSIEEQFSRVCARARECDISLDELKEILELVYKGE